MEPSGLARHARETRFGKRLRESPHGCYGSPMTTNTIYTQSNGGSNEYVVHAVSKTGRFYSVHVFSDSHKGVKVAARKAIKARGEEVRVIESVYLAI